MQQKLSKKHKVLLGLSTVVLGTASVVTPLVSCAKEELDVGSEFDKEFNVTEATYRNMRAQFDRQIDDAISKQAEQEQGKWDDLTIDEIARAKREAYDADMKELDAHVKGEEGVEKTSFTLAVETMSDLAAKNYNIKLTSSTTTASWSDLDEDFVGAFNEAKNYMDSIGTDENVKKQKLDEATKQYGNIKATIENKYGSGNALQGIIQGRQEIITAFDGIEENTTYEVASKKLEDALSNYHIQIKDFVPDPGVTTASNDANPYYETIHDAWDAKEDKILPLYEGTGPSFTNANGEEDQNTLFQKYFTVTDEQGKDVTDMFTKSFFANEWIIGYSVQPDVVKCDVNEVTNENEISIDWKATKKEASPKYANRNIFKTEKNEQIQVHLYKPTEEQAAEMAKKDSVGEALETSNIIYYKSEQAVSHADNEKQALENAYFKTNTANDAEDYSANIGLVYDLENQPSLEKFMIGDVIDGSDDTYMLTLPQLADTGVYIVDKNDESTKIKFYDLLVWREEERAKDPEEQIPDDELTGPQKFMKYCDIVGCNAKVEGDGAEKKVTVSALIAYSNTRYSVKEEQNVNPEWTHKLEAEPLGGITFSKQYFEEASNAYNDALLSFEFYDNIDSLQSIRNKASSSQLGIALFTGIVGLVIASAFIYLAITLAHTTKVRIGIGIVLLLVALGLAVGANVHYDRKHVKPLDNLIAKTKKFRNSIGKEEGSPLQILKDKFSNAKSFFPVRKENGAYDSLEWKQKEEYFNAHEKEAIYLHDYFMGYSSQDEVKELVRTTTTCGVAPADFRKQFDKLSSSGSVLVVVVALLTTGLVLCVLAFAVIARWQERVKKLMHEYTHTVKNSLGQLEEVVIKTYSFGPRIVSLI